jgi:hypothetical protein
VVALHSPVSSRPKPMRASQSSNSRAFSPNWVGPQDKFCHSPSLSIVVRASQVSQSRRSALGTCAHACPVCTACSPARVPSSAQRNPGKAARCAPPSTRSPNSHSLARRGCIHSPPPTAVPSATPVLIPPPARAPHRLLHLRPRRDLCSHPARACTRPRRGHRSGSA